MLVFSFSQEFVISAGSPADVTAFYVGAVYEIKEQGDGVALRKRAAFSSSTTVELQANGRVQIMDGPVTAGG